MEEGRGPRAALFLIAAAARCVPASERASWRREWEAELRGRCDELLARGAWGPGASLRLTRAALGSFADAMSFRREEGREGMMRGWVDEIRLVGRGLGRRPGFALLVVGTLAIGVGASTAMFSVARDVLLRPFPYAGADRLVAVESVDASRPASSGNVTYPNMADLATATSGLDGIALIRWWVPALEDDRGAVVLRGGTVTANFFDVLGVEPGQGRFFGPDEQGEGRPDVVVLAHGLWVDRFGADPSVVGSDIRLSGTTYRVVGVTPASFEDPWMLDGPGGEPQIWRTVWSAPSEWPRSGRSWRAVARLGEDVTLEGAQAEVGAAYARLARLHPEHNADHAALLTPLRERVVGSSRTVLLTLLGSVGLLLVIACANLANLMIARALDRGRETAVHRALGASRARVVGRSVIEASLLAVGGGGVGVALAYASAGVVRGVGALLPRPVTGSIDLPVLLFALGVTIACGLFFGVAPTLGGARGDGRLAPGGGSRGATSDRRGRRTRQSLVVGQIALTATLLVASGLFARSLYRLGAVELGLTTEGVVGVDLHGSAWYDLEAGAAQAQWDEVLAAVRALPGVRAAGAIDYLPLGGSYSCDGTSRDDLPPPEPGEGMCAEVRSFLPGALEALGVGLVRGRLADERDGADATPVAVIDETTATLFWQDGEEPLGARLRVHGSVYEVVGIVRSIRHFGPARAVSPMVYLPASQEGWNGIARGLQLVARSDDGGLSAARLRDAVHAVNPSIAIGSMQSLDALLASNLAAVRFRTALMGFFGATALLLAMLGIAGVMMGSVAKRRRELGVRLALGADPVEVRQMVLGEGVRLAGAGIVLGLAGALALTGMVATLLYEVPSRDPVVFAGVATLLAAASMATCWIPARRASRVDPVVSLQAE